MPLYLCRWPNGDCSLVLAPNKRAAIEILDESANAEGCSMTVGRDFMAQFHLSDSDELELESFGEATEEAVFEPAYPVLEETRLNVPCDENGSLTLEGVAMIQEAEVKERQRIRPTQCQRTGYGVRTGDQTGNRCPHPDCQPSHPGCGQQET